MSEEKPNCFFHTAANTQLIPEPFSFFKAPIYCLVLLTSMGLKDIVKIKKIFLGRFFSD